MVASVPELTMRTISREGTNSHTLSAISVSMAVGAPKLRPFSTTFCTAEMTSGWACPRIMGPQDPT